MTPDLTIHGGPRHCGIYHLVKNGQVVYVGQSSHVLQRVASHSSIVFDEARIYFCPESELNDRERADIERLRPTINAAGITWPYIGVCRAARRAIRVGDEYFMSAEDYLRGLRHVMKRDLRAVGLMKCADDMDLLFAQGFPDPIAERGRAMFWSTPAVLSWVTANRGAA